MVTFPMILMDGPLTRFSRSRHFWSRIYIKYRAFDGQSFYRTLIGNHTKSIEWYHFKWPWVTSDPDFKVTTFLKSNIVKTARLKDKVTIAQGETTSNIWNGTMFGDLDWPINASRRLSAIAEFLVPIGYATSKNVVTLKTGLGVRQSQWCGLRLTALGHDRSETKKNRSWSWSWSWCCRSDVVL